MSVPHKLLTKDTHSLPCTFCRDRVSPRQNHSILEPNFRSGIPLLFLHSLLEVSHLSPALFKGVVFMSMKTKRCGSSGHLRGYSLKGSEIHIYIYIHVYHIYIHIYIYKVCTQSLWHLILTVSIVTFI